MGTSQEPAQAKKPWRYVIGGAGMTLSGLGQLALGLQGHETIRSVVGVVGAISGLLMLAALRGKWPKDDAKN